MNITLTPAEEDALVRFDPASGAAHVESLFIKLNLSDARAVWLKITFLQRMVGRRDAVCEAWAMAFNMGDEPGHVAIKRTFPASEAKVERDSLYVRVGGIELKHGRAKGELVDEAGEHRITWDLAFATEPEGFRHLPYAWMYEGPIPKSKANSPVLDTRFEGSVTVDGQTTKIQAAPGMLGHNWGSEHAVSWCWAHCNRWVDLDGIVFEGVTSRVKMGPVTAPQLTVLHLRVPGERVTMNGAVQLVRTKSKVDGLRWEFKGQRGDRRLEGFFSAEPERFVGVDYHEPDGRVVHCLNSKIADGELVLLGRSDKGWRPLLSAVADRSAALEIGTRDQTHGVRIAIR